MTEELEAMGTAVEGGLLAKALEDERSGAAGSAGGSCLNCDAAVTGRFCGDCGQSLQVHRSIGAFWHDILHGVLHFEGKFWRTLPLLAWKPGELTRRYVHGERSKFISPMALFLFSIFMMFAVFSFLGDPFSGGDAADGYDGWNNGIVVRDKQLSGQIKAKMGQLNNAQGEARGELEQEIVKLKQARNMMATMTMDELPYPEVGLGEEGAGIGNFRGKALPAGGTVSIDDNGKVTGSKNGLELWRGLEESAIGRALKNGVEKANRNPSLLLYKLKANGYKFAWLLIPISLPFVWLTTIGRRGYHFYDHAVFTTYSISFMSLLFIFCAVLAAIGVDASVWGVLLVFYPPFHMYRQLRHAYLMSRLEALVRVSFLLVFTVISLSLFFAILLALGVLG